MDDKPAEIVAKTPPQTLPILYSLRRCPYSMRARLGLAFAGQSYELREIILRRKPAEMLVMSPKGTVPVLKLMDGSVLEESYDIALWALDQRYPEGWTPLSVDQKQAADVLVDELDNSFIDSLNRYKYPDRYDLPNGDADREAGIQFLEKLNEALAANSGYLCASTPSFADVLIFPFVRQFWAVDRDAFETMIKLSHLLKWFAFFLEHPLFKKIMTKYDPWLETRKVSKAPIEVLF